jgi:[ribosomal protein S18]-alanine N-acetyltransferase
MGIEIVSARGGGVDVATLVAIDRASFAQSTLDIAGELARPWAHIWLATSAGYGADAAAFLLAWLVADELHVLSVATMPGLRRQGYATALLEHALGFAREHLVRAVVLEVRRSNADAIRLYRRFGFSAVRFRPRYYADNFEDAVEMILLFDPETGAAVARADEVFL